MPVTITKKVKAKANVKAKSGVSSAVEGIVDTLGTVQKEIKTLKEILKPLEDSEKECKGILIQYGDEYLGIPPDKHYTIAGDKFYAEVGIKAEQTTIPDARIVFDTLEDIQEGLGFELMKFNITDLKKYLPGVTLQEITETARTGARRFKVTEKPQ